MIAELNAWDWAWTAFVVLGIHVLMPLLEGRGKRGGKH